MKNTEQAKLLLQKALREIPDDFALSEVRFHVKHAIYKLEKVEKKREIREINSQKRKENIINPFNAQQTLKLIDELIETEKGKLTPKNEKKDMLIE